MKKMLVAATAVALLSTSAFAQDSSYTPGSYWTVSMIDVLPGQGENYADFLADQWKRSQDHAKSKGWIEEYHVMANVNARDGEPDLFLITQFKEMTTRAEDQRRAKEYEAFMQSDPHRLATASGARGVMRVQKGSMLLQEMNLKPKK
jgi:opacity protein-like surface antigen